MDVGNGDKNASKTCILIGAPVQDGTGRLGCDMGPSAFRAAGIGEALRSLGYDVRDSGNLAPAAAAPAAHPNQRLRALPEIAGWAAGLSDAVYTAAGVGMPIVLGGDHSLAAGTLPAHARRAAEAGRPLFVLWLDAHPDLHTLETTESGNLHGVPMAYALGLPGFEGFFPPLAAKLDPAKVCMMGLRSVDAAERRLLAETGIRVHDMRAIDENGVASLLRGFLAEVEAADGMLHVSLDVDFLDPEIAPGVGTTVPGGATFREAHLIMEMLHDSARVTGLDLVELNPFLDERGRTARLMVDLTASLMGRSVLDRPTRSY
jgi:arginase